VGKKHSRRVFNTLSRLINEFRQLRAAADASGGPREIVTSLDAGQEVPNTSGLAGAHTLSKAEWASLLGVIDDILLNYDTAAIRQILSKSSGVNAGL
jgi:hypothetical protein